MQNQVNEYLITRILFAIKTDEANIDYDPITCCINNSRKLAFKLDHASEDYYIFQCNENIITKEKSFNVEIHGIIYTHPEYEMMLSSKLGGIRLNRDDADYNHVYDICNSSLFEKTEIEESYSVTVPGYIYAITIFCAPLGG
jgi:hypothetical protein